MKIDWSLIDDGRIARSRDVQIKTIYSELEQADFVGSDNSVHTATLENCTCVDFKRNPYRPCKHMIRLASEINRLDELRNQQISIFEDLSDESTDCNTEKRPGKKHHSCTAFSDYVVIDLEATDRNTATAGIIELAAVRVKDNCIVDTFSTLANPGVKNTPSAFAVNKITDEMIESAPHIDDALESFLDFIGDLPVVGHNIASYDTVLLYDQCMKSFGTPFTNNIVDTYWFSRATHKDMPTHTLYAMCSYYDIINENAHRALSDVLCTQQLYEILKRYVPFDEVLPASFVLGGYSPEQIYKSILEITEDTEQNVVLKKNKTASSIYMFGAVAFVIRVNSRSQYLETATAVANEFVGIIPGSSTVKAGYRFPIACPKSAASDYRDMILTVYEYRQEAAIGEKFGCCNDFRRCSDARECLHKNDDDYRGCYYRKNLEAGRIFYGINKNC